MGYTHYWYRAKELDAVKFSAAVRDFKILIPHLAQAGVTLADGHGKGIPILHDDAIFFNGPEKCGHDKRDLGITWPAPKAGGVAAGKVANSGTWFAGAQLASRTCDGDCSHETFGVHRRQPKRVTDTADTKGRLFDFCKTAYKPYDLAVTAALIILKHYFPQDIAVSSDGEEKDWFDGKLLCKTVLGYGMEFKLTRGDE